jgi:hypothetical protein
MPSWPTPDYVTFSRSINSSCKPYLRSSVLCHCLHILKTNPSQAKIFLIFASRTHTIGFGKKPRPDAAKSYD